MSVDTEHEAYEELIQTCLDAWDLGSRTAEEEPLTELADNPLTGVPGLYWAEGFTRYKFGMTFPARPSKEKIVKRLREKMGLDRDPTKFDWTREGF